MSILARKNSRGRPKVDSEELRSRAERSLIVRLDAWAEAQGNIGRSEAIRRLLEHALAEGGPKGPHTVEQKISIAQEVIANTPIPKKRTPERGLAMLKRGKAEAALAGLKAQKQPAAADAGRRSAGTEKGPDTPLRRGEN